ESHLLPADRKRDVARLGPIDVLGLEPLDEFYRLANASLQLGESLLLVGIFRDLCAGEPCGRALGEISGDLYLAHERSQLSITSGSMSRSSAKASAFSRIAVRFFSICRKAGTEAAYIPNDMESHLHETIGGGRDL